MFVHALSEIMSVHPHWLCHMVCEQLQLPTRGSSACVLQLTIVAGTVIGLMC